MRLESRRKANFMNGFVRRNPIWVGVEIEIEAAK